MHSCCHCYLLVTECLILNIWKELPLFEKMIIKTATKTFPMSLMSSIKCLLDMRKCYKPHTSCPNHSTSYQGFCCWDKTVPMRFTTNPKDTSPESRY